jgi:hypothetical protein
MAASALPLTGVYKRAQCMILVPLYPNLSMVSDSAHLVKNLLSLAALFHISEEAVRHHFRDNRNIIRLLNGKSGKVFRPTLDAIDRFLKVNKIELAARSLLEQGFDVHAFAPKQGFGVIEHLFRHTTSFEHEKLERFLGGQQSMHYYMLSEGRRGYRQAQPDGRAQCWVRDLRMFRAPTGDLFMFESGRDLRKKLPLVRGDPSLSHAFPIITGYVTLLHSTLVLIGACPYANDIEPVLIKCFMSSITPYCFFGLQHGSFQVAKQHYARTIAFIQATNYTEERLGFKDWEEVDPRLKLWLCREDPQETYLLVNEPPVDIYSFGADRDFKF